MALRYMAAQPSGQSTSSSRSNWPRSAAPLPRPRFWPSGKIRWPALSMRPGSSQTSTLLAAMPTSGALEQARWSAASHPSAASASLLISATKSPCAAAIPWLLAAQKPRFSRLRITRTPNSASAMSAEPSSEPLSTTMASNATSPCRRSESRQARSNSLRFQFTTTTEINRLC